MKREEIPHFGVLDGVKVVHSSAAIAGPFCAELLAEMGADVTWIENPKSLDANREHMAVNVENDRKNMRNISFAIPTPEGKEILLRLLKGADIFMEANIAGTYDKWGLTDEALWEVNPRLVICHMSGFGATGDPKFVARGTYDSITQAFSGFLNNQGYPDRPAVPAQTMLADFITGYASAMLCLAALHRVEVTGEGESIDFAQYEAMLRVQGHLLMDYLLWGVKPVRQGADMPLFAGWGSYECKDGKYCFMVAFGVPQMKRILPVIGFEYGSEEFPAGVPCIVRNSEAGKKVEAKLHEMASRMTAAEFEARFWDEADVPCCRVMEYDDMVEHPHFKARGSFIEWDAAPGSPYEGRKITGPGPIARFKKSGDLVVWRGAPYVGNDNEDILHELGYGDDEIAALYDNEILRQEKYIPSDWPKNT